MTLMSPNINLLKNNLLVRQLIETITFLKKLKIRSSSMDFQLKRTFMEQNKQFILESICFKAKKSENFT